MHICFPISTPSTRVSLQPSVFGPFHPTPELFHFLKWEHFMEIFQCSQLRKHDVGQKKAGHDFLLFQGFGIQASYLQLHWLWYAHIFHKPAHHVTVNIPWHFSIVSCFRHTSPIQNCSMCFRIWMADNFPSAHRLRRAVARLLPLPFSRGFFFLLLPNASSSFHPLSLLHFSIVPGALFTEARLQSFAFPYPPSAQGALFPKARLQIFAFPFHKVTTVQR